MYYNIKQLLHLLLHPLFALLSGEKDAHAGDKGGKKKIKLLIHVHVSYSLRQIKYTNWHLNFFWGKPWIRYLMQFETESLRKRMRERKNTKKRRDRKWSVREYIERESAREVREKECYEGRERSERKSRKCYLWTEEREYIERERERKRS